MQNLHDCTLAYVKSFTFKALLIDVQRTLTIMSSETEQSFRKKYHFNMKTMSTTQHN